jgi:hypothetical protein
MMLKDDSKYFENVGLCGRFRMMDDGDGFWDRSRDCLAVGVRESAGLVVR